MDVLHSQPISDQTVLQRTSAGARALVFETVHEDTPEWRLLAMLTGHTPLDALIGFGLDEGAAYAAARRLLAMELAVRVRA